VQKIIHYLKDLLFFRPCDTLSYSGKIRDRRLRIRLILMIAPLSLFPLFIVMTVSYFWLQNLLKEDFQNQLRWDLENTKNSIEFFVNVKLSALRFLASGHRYEQLSNQKILADVFTAFKQEFGQVVDLGLIDAEGIQQSYAGPYHLKGKDYSNQEWFHQAVARGIYVSDVFMGYRKVPHFAIAVKKEVPEEGSFWIIRATINMETLNSFVSSINLNSEDDAFIINESGILQTPSRFYGNVLEQYPLRNTLNQRGVSVLNTKQANGKPAMFGYAYIKDSPWILCTVIKSRPDTKIARLFQGEFFAILIGSLLFVILIAMRMAQIMVNWIKDCDQKREAALSEAEHASKLASVGRLAAGVAHEINNPLAIINEKAGLIKDILAMSGDVSAHREKILNSVKGILDSVNRSSAITHRLLGFSRRMDVTPELFDVNDVIKEVLGFLEKEILFRDIRLIQDLKEGLPIIQSNRGRLQQVFLNIINNAIDAVNTGGCIDIASKVKDENTIYVVVKDNGKGIPKAALKHIFEPFFTTKEKEKGTGLGLFISYGIIKQLGGNILVESEVKKGTVFTIELPLISAAG